MPGITLRDGGVREAEAQRGLRQVHVRAEILAQRVDVLHHLLLAIAAEIEVAEIAGREGGGRGRCVPESAPSSSGTRARMPIFSSCAERQHARFGRLVEDVVDHLHGVDLAGAHDGERGIGIVLGGGDADAAALCRSVFRSSKARRHSSRSIHASFQTWSCSRSMVSSFRLRRLSSAQAMM